MRIALKLVLHLFGQVLVWVIGLLAISALPALYVEFACQSPREPAGAATPRIIAEAPWRRPEVNSFLSYPEWYIVHAYEDFAAVTRTADEHAFGYVPAVTGYWSSLCDITRRTTRREATPGDMKAMLYIIGVSFTAEMIVKGAWELTIGRATAWWRGPQKNAEDRFAADMSARYATFLTQTPWYQFPFAATLGRFWRETAFGEPSTLRSLERRFALTAEWGVKAGYGWALGLAAGLTPADLRIRSVVAGLPADRLAAIPGITVIGPAGGDVLIETDRYRAFTDLARAVTAEGGRFVEIAGNRRALVTLVMPDRAALAVPGGERLFAVAVQARPGFSRIGLDLPVERFAEAVAAASAGGGALEHLYDY
ncbi:hypothetical protein [Phreatobacter sp.]|uniref:hypothetical protein n=1 Tax=Phreatobacter sp. TaxID=1966341 RepID=UPI003F70660D